MYFEFVGQFSLSSNKCFISISVNEFPVLKADAIKYIMVFRTQVSLFVPEY